MSKWKHHSQEIYERRIKYEEKKRLKNSKDLVVDLEIEPEATKICKYCGETKVLSDFKFGKKDVRTNKCKKCHSIYVGMMATKKIEDTINKYRPVVLEKKVCIACNEELPVSNFYSNTSMRDGYLNTCKRCHIAKNKTRKDKMNRAKHNEEIFKNYISDLNTISIEKLITLYESEILDYEFKSDIYNNEKNRIEWLKEELNKRQ